MNHARIKKMLIMCMMIPGIVALISGLTSGVSAEDKKLDLALCAPGQTFTIDIDNPFILYYPAGRQSTLIGEEDDETVIVRITVLDKTEILYEGMPDETATRVVEEMEAVDENEDRVIQNEEVIEQSFNYYTQRTADDTVCYFGEEVWERPEEAAVPVLFDSNDVPEPGVIVPGLVRNMEGEWRADEADSSPGVFFPASADAIPGTKFQQENGPPDAMDEMKIVGSGSVMLEEVTIDGEEMEEVTFEDVRRGREFNPVDGDKGYKTFARDVGIIMDEDFELKETGVLP